MITEKCESRPNLKICNITCSIFNDNVNDSVMNVTIVTLVQIDNMKVYIRLAIPESIQDVEYKKEVFATIVDAKKLLSGTLGVSGSMFVKQIIENITSKLGVKGEFPLKKVKSNGRLAHSK
jgi:hypothetical protein